MKSQEQVIEELFDSKGYTNHLQASFFKKLGQEVHDERPRALRKTFPEVHKADTEEWANAYGLVCAFLEAKQMDMTAENLKSNQKDFIPRPAEDLVDTLELKNTNDPLRELLKTHKIRQLLNPRSADIKIETEFYKK